MQISWTLKSMRNILLALALSMLVLSQFQWASGQAPEPKAADPVEIRWSVGIGTGADPGQVVVEQQVVDDFNATHPGIHVTLEVISNGNAREIIRTEIVNGNAPDLVGPVGWQGANSFHGQWLDLASRITSTGFNSSIFTPGLMDTYNTDEGQIGLPFSTFPSALYYNPALFPVGVNPPPAHYGDLYEMPNHDMVTWSWDTLTQVAKLLTLDNTGKNSTEAGFDANNVVQYGFSFGWENNPAYWGAFWKAGTLLQGLPGSYSAVVPDDWKAAWQWFYDGMWGAQPFIPNGGNGGDSTYFSAGHVAMLENPAWYLCCINDLPNAGGTFQLGAMPSYNGSVGGRVDADTFRILKVSAHPDEAFTLLAYLVTTGVDKLIVGSSSQGPAYGGAISAIAAKQTAWVTTQSTKFPFVSADSWNIMLAGLNYPDDPSAEGFMPNMIESWNRMQDLSNLIRSNSGLDLAAVETTLETDLTTIFNNEYRTISGNAGAAGVTLNYFDGGDRIATSISDGTYALTVSDGWSGTVTPSLLGFIFKPAYKTYNYVLIDQVHQDYAAWRQLFLPLVVR
jgi:multiple sugar transport system substrate-binding protein